MNLNEGVLIGRMDFMSIKIAAIDLDGTTLNDCAKLPPENREAIIRAAGQGVHVVVCTGRTNDELPGELLKMPELRYGVLANGAKIVDLSENRVLYHDFLGREQVEQAIRFAEKYRCMCELYINGKVYARRSCLDDVTKYGVTPRLKQLVEGSRTGVDDLLGFFRSSSGEVEKLNIFFGNPEHRKAFLRDVEDFSSLVEITGSMETNAEINSKTATKGNGLAYLAKLLGFDRQEVLAIGDSGNDISMLKFAGTSLAVANADDNVKALADEIVPANTENGLAYAFEKYI